MPTAPDSGEGPTAARRAMRGDLLVFAMNGFGFASWMARVPDVKQTLHLTPGRLGVMLLAISLGSLCGLPLAGRIAHRLGARRAVRLGLVLSMAGFILAAVAVTAHTSMWLVMPGLAFVGLGNGIWDVSMNLEGTAIEQGIGRAIMPWFHAAFSGGTVVGALLGALMVHLGVGVLPHLLLSCALTLVGALLGTGVFLPAFDEADADQPADAAPERSPWLEPRTLMVGLMVLAAAFTEGTANDWMAVAFVDGHHHTPAVGVVAFAVFLVFMTAGRTLGTGLLDRFGRVPVLRVMFVSAILGCLLVVFGGPWLSFVGTAIWGLGASLGFPVGMSAAADDPARAHARLSTVSTIGYTAFLAGPPLLGLLGNVFGVLHALLLVGIISACALAVLPAARPQVPDAA